MPMKRLIMLLLVAAIGLPIAAEVADAARARVVKRGHRTKVVVHRGFPIRRAMPVVVVRPARVAVRVRPAVYLVPVVWTAAVVTRPAAADLVWEDGESMTADEDWTEFTLNVDNRGRGMMMHVDGRVQFNFAEVVFENGDARVVDFNNRTHSTGTYGLIDFADGRKVDHVRMVAKAKSDEARVSVLMVK
jgi:hypothetical protein